MSWLGRLLFGSSGPREGDPLPLESATTPMAVAMATAEGEARRRGLPWDVPVDAQLIIRRRRPHWVIRPYAEPGVRGGTFQVVVADRSGEVVDVLVQPR
jgi:hypothetical protein